MVVFRNFKFKDTHYVSLGEKIRRFLFVFCLSPLLVMSIDIAELAPRTNLGAAMP